MMKIVLTLVALSSIMPATARQVRVGEVHTCGGVGSPGCKVSSPPVLTLVFVGAPDSGGRWNRATRVADTPPGVMAPDGSVTMTIQETGGSRTVTIPPAPAPAPAPLPSCHSRAQKLRGDPACNGAQ